MCHYISDMFTVPFRRWTYKYDICDYTDEKAITLVAQLKAKNLSCPWGCVEIFIRGFTVWKVSDIFMVPFWNYGPINLTYDNIDLRSSIHGLFWSYGPISLANDYTIGEFAFLAQLEVLYLSCLCRCVKSSALVLFPRYFTVTLYICRYFYFIIFKIWTHTFKSYNNTVTEEIALLA